MSHQINNYLPPDFLSDLNIDQREEIMMAISKAYFSGFSDARRLTELAEIAQEFKQHEND